MKLEDVRTIVEGAVRAPSVHNTQPWRFAVHSDDEGEAEAIDVFGDRERLLGVIDPEGRELHISCGAAIEFACIRARSLGLACSVQLLPDPANPDHFARIGIGPSTPPAADEIASDEALRARYTERGRFDDRPVPAELVEELRLATSAAGAWMRVLDQRGDEVTTAVLLSRADDLERADPAYEQELADWVGHDDESVDDGIPRAALSSVPSAERASSFRLRDFEGGAEPGRPYPPGDPPAPERPLVVVLGTPSDDPRAWLEAGQALGRLLVRASLDGVFASPMTQVLEVPATRSMLTGQLGLVGHPQILLRLGYGHGRPISPRRPVDEVLTT